MSRISKMIPDEFQLGMSKGFIERSKRETLKVEQKVEKLVIRWELEALRPSVIEETSRLRWRVDREIRRCIKLFNEFIDIKSERIDNIKKTRLTFLRNLTEEDWKYEILRKKVKELEKDKIKEDYQIFRNLFKELINDEMIIKSGI
ncbi:hypothetical protein RclHR1_35810001 [Rhizophagus clarus]|uniref:Uncharacterized protein n=1 Tax=Rhizophagus clarus TaxID=94130 RepID=A0A2Z6S5X4_9GLOM|nr:hypothetical protein RclHR1_35810001 [Rhizophagus clarus]GES78819.1 hypothetical protein RCL_jg21705.t1 [Rhizophagus clarus]